MQINYRALIKQHGRRGIYPAGHGTLRGERGGDFAFFGNMLCTEGT